jgi:hypothetical protein
MRMVRTGLELLSFSDQKEASFVAMQQGARVFVAFPGIKSR